MNLKIIKKNMGILYMEFKNAKDNCWRIQT